MSDIKKLDLKALEAMPTIFANIIPALVPQRNWGDSVIDGFFHNLRLESMARTKGIETAIAKSNLEQTKFTIEGIKLAITFSQQLEEALDLLEHAKKLRQIEIIKLSAEANILLFQAKSDELDCQMKQRELNGFTEDKNRT